MTQSVVPSGSVEWVHVNFIGNLPNIISLPSSEEGDFQWVDPLNVDSLDMVSEKFFFWVNLFLMSRIN
ncbi:hypothetical protein COT44_02635 [Candidatus Shapirobacteria bacterium CG08_land_8_20_14_0_20_39_18]|uniref:Uncharacterized protein n=1 Tax=Candidatus Shapirobacteria bacterium CG08_land_8_20_14_0_20_39_18 TaxID=1974883 RepID=A0A2M6XD18_9BACT|nr:MAG: hypothetical protein COT44_02635 [Candidatus Shapirobacteria bacterium CG08_land_8_20_14_0_20_39_18]PIY65292.1 MAG: hypothetical protein COY91_02655 [Candidatus Shapirobacteria bacterium CG_4_10_14_0_8_um_filter_39_15]PJE68367.1 MAG: hypothetical protein COU94_02180 [Candidatus Shapirobacteria bacterium CG10_big_fil_rev_8_21_14_0_10_38_8]